MEELFVTVEIDVILNKLKNYLSFEENNKFISNPQMITDFYQLKSKLEVLADTYKFVVAYDDLLFSHIEDLSGEIKYLELGNIVSFTTMYQIYLLLDNVDSAIFCFKDKKDFTIIKETFIANLGEIKHLKDLLFATIESDLSIKDGASINLKSIRIKLKRENQMILSTLNNLVNKYKNSLASTSYTMKSGQYVLAINESSKNTVHGIIQDVSSTGQTIYVTPYEIIEIQNRIFSLEEDEREEILLIQKQLSEVVHNNLGFIIRNYLTLLEFDLVLSKARFGKSYEGQVVKLEKKMQFFLPKAYHLMLNSKKIIKNDFSLGGEEKDTMLISGPNAGGKTVALKTLAQIAILNQLAMMVPTDGESFLPVFDNIFVIIGDQQSLFDNLSTFSGHINAINKCLKKITNRTLVIIDEICQGTSPLDGTALAIGFCQYIHSQHALAVITSHFEGLKEFGLKQEYILNASMLFNEKTLDPTFKILLNVVGKSYGIEVATRLGVKSEVISRAKSYQEEMANTIEQRTLKSLEDSLRKNEQLNYELIKEKNRLSKSLENARSEESAFRLKIKNLEDENARKVEEMLEEKLEEIDDIMRELKTIKTNPNIAKIKGKIKELSTANFVEEVEAVTFYPGDYVRILSNNATGIVTRVRGENITVLSNGMSYSLLARTIIKETKVKEVKQKVVSIDRFVSSRVGYEINVIGQHIEEALDEVGKYLDSALLMNYTSVRIIHGFGTGKLRKAIQDSLAKNKNIKEFRNGGEGEGGLGATVVILR